MINATQTSVEPEAEVKTILQQVEFGAALKKAREEAGLTTYEIARKLLISEDIVKAIDNSQADILPAITFTQGYIRSYARILNVPANDIIAAYISMAPDSMQVLTPTPIIPRNKSGNNIIITIISVVFVIVFLAILFSWFYQTDFSLELDKFKSQSDLTDNKSLDSNNFNERVEYNAAVETSGEVTTVPDGVDADADLSSLYVEPLDAKEIAIIKADAADIKKAEVVKTEAVANSGEPIVSDEIVLTALEQSWVEVQDAAGNRLYYQLLDKGAEVVLSGQAPFKVFLGNARQVRIEINHKIVNFDHLINRNKDVANFMIAADAKVGISTVR